MSFLWSWEFCRWNFNKDEPELRGHTETGDVSLNVSAEEVNIHSLEKVWLSHESKGRIVQTEGRKIVIRFRAELGVTARESEQQIGSVCLPCHKASTPEQLLTLVAQYQSISRRRHRVPRLPKVGVRVHSLPLPRKLDLHFGETRVSCVWGVCNVLDQTASSVAWVTAWLHGSVPLECYRMTLLASFLCIHSSADCKSTLMSFH